VAIIIFVIVPVITTLVDTVVVSVSVVGTALPL
jgi:hypothetical protein